MDVFHSIKEVKQCEVKEVGTQTFDAKSGNNSKAFRIDGTHMQSEELRNGSRIKQAESVGLTGPDPNLDLDETTVAPDLDYPNIVEDETLFNLSTFLSEFEREGSAEDARWQKRQSKSLSSLRSRSVDTSPIFKHRKHVVASPQFSLTFKSTRIPGDGKHLGLGDQFFKSRWFGDHA